MRLSFRTRAASGHRSLLLPLTLLALLGALATPVDAVSLRDLFRAALGSWGSGGTKAEVLPEVEVEDTGEVADEEYPWSREGEEGEGEEGREEAEVEEGKAEEGKAEEVKEEVAEGAAAAPAEHHPLFNPLHHHHHPGHHHHPVITIYATMTHYIQVTSTKHTIPMCVSAAVPSLPSCPAGDDTADGGPHLEHSVFTHRALDGDQEEIEETRSKGARALRGESGGDDDQEEERGPLEQPEGDDQEERMMMKPMKPMGWSLFGQKHHHVHHHIHKNKKEPFKSPVGGSSGSKPVHPLHPAHPAHPMHPSNLLGLGNLANGIVGNVGAAGWWGGGHGHGHWGGGHIVQHHGEPYLGPHHHHRLVTELLTKTKLLTKVVTKVNHKVRATLVAQNCLPDPSQMPHCDAYPYAPIPHHPGAETGLLPDEAPYGGLFYGLHPDSGHQTGMGPYPIPNPPYEAFYASQAKDGDNPEDVEPSSSTPGSPTLGPSGRTPPLLWASQLFSTGNDGKTLHAADAEDDANEVEEEVEMEWTG